MTGPVQNNNPVPPPIVDPFGPGITTYPGLDLDPDTISSLSTANSQVLDTSMNSPKLKAPALFAVMQAVSNAISASKSISFESDAAISKINSTYYRDMIFIATGVLKILLQILDLQRKTDAVVAQIDPDIQGQNSAIASMNSTVGIDHDLTVNMNTAVDHFNVAVALFQFQTYLHDTQQLSDTDYNTALNVFNGYLAEYNTAKDFYNSIVGPRNAQIGLYNQTIVDFNTRVDDHNAQIDEINNERLDLGIFPLLPHQDKQTDFRPLLTPASDFSYLNFAPQVPVLSANPIPFQAAYPRPIPENILTSFFIVIILTRILSMTNLLLKHVEINQNSNEFFNFYLRTNFLLVGLANAYAPTLASSNVTTAGSSVNAGLAAISNALDPVVVSQLYNKGNQDAYAKAFTSILGLGVFDATLLANASVLDKSAIIAAQRLFDKLDALGVDYKDSESLAGAIALEFAAALSGIAGNNGVAGGLSELLSLDINDPTLKALSATIGLSNSGVAISLLSASLGIPGLGAQLLLAAGLSQEEVFNLTSQGNGVNDFLFNPLTQGLAGGVLAASITNSLGGDLSLGQQEALSKSILLAASQTSPLNPNGFFDNLSKALSDNGISGNLSNSILQSAQSGIYGPIAGSREELRSSIAGSLQAQGYSYDDAGSVADAIAGTEGGNGSFNQDLFKSNLAYTLGQAGISSQSDIVNNVIQGLSANIQEVNEATFRDNLQKELTKNGLNQDQALRVATGVAYPVISANNALTALTATNALSTDDLRSNLQNKLTDYFQPIIGAKAANLEATHYTNAIVGKDAADPNSLVNVLNQQISTLKNQKDDSLFNASINSFKDYLKPSTDVNTFNNRLVDLAYHNLYAQDLIHQQASNTGTVKIGGINPNPIMGPA